MLGRIEAQYLFFLRNPEANDEINNLEEDERANRGEGGCGCGGQGGQNCNCGEEGCNCGQGQ